MTADEIRALLNKITEEHDQETYALDIAVPALIDTIHGLLTWADDLHWSGDEVSGLFANQLVEQIGNRLVEINKSRRV